MLVGENTLITQLGRGMLTRIVKETWPRGTEAGENVWTCWAGERQEKTASGEWEKKKWSWEEGSWLDKWENKIIEMLVEIMKIN